jgi:hypothetical protein
MTRLLPSRHVLKSKLKHQLLVLRLLKLQLLVPRLQLLKLPDSVHQFHGIIATHSSGLSLESWEYFGSFSVASLGPRVSLLYYSFYRSVTMDY